MYCHQIEIGNFFVLYTIQRQIMYQNDRIFKRNWLTLSPPAIYILRFKEYNENDMAAYHFWAVFCSSQWPMQINPTADFNGAAIPPPIISMATSIKGTVATLECKPRCTRTSAFLCSFFWKVNHATPKSIHMERKHSFLHLQVISILLENLTAGHCRPANT